MKEPRASRSLSSVLKQQDAVGGLVVIAVAVFAFWQGAPLPIGTMGGMGPGMTFVERPVSLGLLVLALAVMIIAVLPAMSRRRDEAFQE